MTTQEVISKYLGQPVEAEDPTNVDQCMDWAFKYCDEIGVDRVAIRHLYAYQVYTEPNDTTVKYFEIIPNTQNGIPQAGDLVIFSNKVGVAGHISTATGEGDTNLFKSADQNWNGHHYVEIVSHPYDFVLGWLRPRNNHAENPASTPTQLVITDQTHISQIENKEVQAIKSELFDLRAKVPQLIALEEDLQKQLDELKKAPKSVGSNPVTVISTTPIFTNSAATFIYENFLKPFKK